ncbi:MAG TPA: hypothetical protein EYH32_10855 [Anaerolineae bacterium]|nr:hypothetical protein [Anaerolineae bacterium]
MRRLEEQEAIRIIEDAVREATSPEEAGDRVEREVARRRTLGDRWCPLSDWQMWWWAYRIAKGEGWGRFVVEFRIARDESKRREAMQLMQLAIRQAKAGKKQEAARAAADALKIAASLTYVDGWPVIQAYGEFQEAT